MTFVQSPDELGNVAAGFALCLADSGKTAGVHRDRGPDASARGRREYGDLQCRQRLAFAASAVSAPRAVGANS